MLKNLGLVLIALLVNFIFNTVSYAETAVYTLPPALQQQLKLATEQLRKAECDEAKLSLSSELFYSLPTGELLILMGLPSYMCHIGSFMPTMVDRQGHWSWGDAIDGYPALLLTDSTRGYWLVSHGEIEGVYPELRHSRDGLHWQEITLPESRNIDCCFEWLKQVCEVDGQIQLQFSGMDDEVTGFWSTTLNDSLTATPHWQKRTPEQVQPATQCQTTPLNQGNWQRKLSPNGKTVRFQSTQQRSTVVIPNWLK
ncbi:MAG: hypothetical protein PHU06_10145 [Gallionella sp.]|nr:hypothetical protein [Gallionella sp.]MDD4958896.1 hypothetical protein [Gallionella sp.]